MAERDKFEKDFDTMMKAILLKSILEDKTIPELVPFKVEVTVTPTSITSHAEGNKRFLKDIEGGEEWFQETYDLINPIMKEQTTKFAKLLKQKFGFEIVESDKCLNTDATRFVEFLRSLFGGGAKR